VKRASTSRVALAAGLIAAFAGCGGGSGGGSGGEGIDPQSLPVFVDGRVTKAASLRSLRIAVQFDRDLG
jgi:hypothetical protein